MTTNEEFDTTPVYRFVKGNPMKAIIAAAIVVATCGMASANEWSAKDDKGLKVYNLRDGSATLDLVCDPDNLWEPPEYHLVVKQGGNILDGSSVEIKKGEEALTMPLSGGSILSTDRDGWNKLIELLSQPGLIEFHAGENTVALNATSALTSGCARQAAE